MPAQAIMSSRSAIIVELFSSVQGEGILVGRRQAFLRLPGCNLKCNYCDTVHAISETCDVEMTPGLRDFQKVSNPVSLELMLERLNGWKRNWPLLHHSLSITGGEPLLHSELLAEWLPSLRTVFPIFLETNGLLTDPLLDIIKYVDIISMDIKLPSTSGHQNLWDKHAAFLEVATQTQCYVKLVVGKDTGTDEIMEVTELIAAQKGHLPLILQPVTGQLTDQQIGAHLLRLQQAACMLLDDVRVIPQTHTLLNIM